MHIQIFYGWKNFTEEYGGDVLCMSAVYPYREYIKDLQARTQLTEESGVHPTQMQQFTIAQYNTVITIHSRSPMVPSPKQYVALFYIEDFLLQLQLSRSSEDVIIVKEYKGVHCITLVMGHSIYTG
ncbi:hypothetical protein BCR42DRAFT_393264 [Absidia repens]|uniref:Uncharacterized protein n=1 Tax=Absidia repens TaxID=90262 RepID=A0A1X2IF95_9FUNG|nr:hypothetical protein BCR42DRAFT_393264 [Absidia repens]